MPVLERLNEALDLVESCLAHGEDVDVAALARVAATSEHHFRRMFSTLAGMSVSEYVRRRRLTLAASDVLSGELSLLDVAVRHGYGSTEAFGRAFRAVHGMKAGEARRRGGSLVSQPRISFHLVVEGRTSMRYRIVEKPSFRIVGRKARVPLVHEGPNQAIIDFVRGLELPVREKIAALSDQEPAGTVAVTDAIDESRAEGTELDYWHGAVTSGEVPPGLESLEVSAGTWVVFEVTGRYPEAMQVMWRDAYVEWFPSNPWRTRPGPEILRTVILGDDEAEAELWLPVESDRPRA
jgi:AraC family transcriptional regulator